MIEQKVRTIAKDYNIPQNDLKIIETNDVARQRDIINVSFRGKNKIKKYSAELAYDSNSNFQMDILEIQIDRMLSRLEEKWLNENGNVTYYKGQAFFWRHYLTSDKSSFEVECSTCGELASVSKESHILDEYFDVYLMMLLPEVFKMCECNDRKI